MYSFILHDIYSKRIQNMKTIEKTPNRKVIANEISIKSNHVNSNEHEQTKPEKFWKMASLVMNISWEWVFEAPIMSFIAINAKWIKNNVQKIVKFIGICKKCWHCKRIKNENQTVDFFQILKPVHMVNMQEQARLSVKFWKIGNN